MNRVLSVKMADGVRLSTEVNTPEFGGSWPVLVARTPYGKPGLMGWLSPLTKQGYAVVVQDTRGTGQSEGVFSFLTDELADATDTGKWILEQPFCDGSLGLLGISYLGASSVGLALSFPQNVKAALWVAPVLGGHSLFHTGGALQLHHNLPWAILADPKFKELEWAEAYRHLPLKDALKSANIGSPLWNDICSYAVGDAVPADLSEAFRSIDVPGLHFGGFWDFMLNASLYAWEAANPSGGKRQPVFLGPWSHNGMAGEITKNAHTDYGAEASSALGRRLVQWFDHFLKGQELPPDLMSPVSAYIPSRGWVRRDILPGGACTASASIGSASAAGSSCLDLYLGDGALEEEPAATGRCPFVYDPANPIPTEGGALWEFPRAGLEPGPAVVTTGGRDDVLVFESRALERSVTALGPVEVLLYAGTDAPSTDFTAKLVDVDAGSTPRIVGDSICRVGQSPAADGGQIAIRIPGIGHVFDAGHRIRLDISSSNFPRFDRNLNTGVSGLVSSKMRTANQTVGYGNGSPSRLRLRILE